MTRAQWPDKDLGDSEQTPSDLASIADYTHLTALIAPRALQLTHNAKDTCCYRADYALGPLVQQVRPVFGLLGASGEFAYHVNYDEGHNYEADNREAFYRFLHTRLLDGRSTFDPREIDVSSEIRDVSLLAVPVPTGNADFRTLALRIAEGLPSSGPPRRDRLQQLVRYQRYDARAVPAARRPARRSGSCTWITGRCRWSNLPPPRRKARRCCWPTRAAPRRVPMRAACSTTTSVSLPWTPSTSASRRSGRVISCSGCWCPRSVNDRSAYRRDRWPPRPAGWPRATGRPSASSRAAAHEPHRARRRRSRIGRDQQRAGARQLADAARGPHPQHLGAADAGAVHVRAAPGVRRPADRATGEPADGQARSIIAAVESPRGGAVSNSIGVPCLAMVALLSVSAETSRAQSSAAGAPAAPQVNAFPAEARIGFVDLNRIASLSNQGKSLAARVEEVRAKKEAEVAARGKEVAGLESKLSETSPVLSDAARDQLRRQFERAQVDFQRFTQDAQAEVQQVQRELEQAFMQKAFPVIGAVAKEKSLWAVFSVGQSGLVWRDPTLDLSEEVARRIDAEQ